MASLTTKFPTCTNYVGFTNIQESKYENQDKVRNVPLKMKRTEQSVFRHFLEEERIRQRYERNHQRYERNHQHSITFEWEQY